MRAIGKICENPCHLRAKKKRKAVPVTGTTNLNLKPNTIKISVAKVGVYVLQNIYSRLKKHITDVKKHIFADF
ncbi:hypothetical protein FACS18945_1750 [Bacteroidia bacterium]|nr:hypothetical protein FACS18945_1750 [Bacteroidia bacterium]